MHHFTAHVELLLLRVGGAIATGIGILGAILIYKLGDENDEEWEKFKKQIFE